MSKDLIINYTDKYEEYLSDESKIQGKASSISFPESTEEVIEILKINSEKNIPVTIQGALTGICAGAVPTEGHIMNLSKMNKIIGMNYREDKDCFTITVEPGVTLQDLKHTIISKEFDITTWSDKSKEALKKFKRSTTKMFPPDPTESLATIGGIVACDASGALSYYYGSVRRYVDSIRVVLPNRDKYIKREKCINTLRETSSIKNAAGYYLHKDMELIDLFIGSEGTLGIITEVELRLIDKTKLQAGVFFFFTAERNAISFVKWLRQEKSEDTIDNVLKEPVAIEYFNKDALRIINEFKSIKTELKELPIIDEDISTAIYVEYHSDSEEEIDSILEQLLEASLFFKAKDGTEWCGFEEWELQRMRNFRHAVPECVNLMISEKRRNCAGISKIGTDMAVANDKLEQILEMYKSDLEKSGLNSVMFGHIGDNHIHVNIIPSNIEEYNLGKQLVKIWSTNVILMGGTITAEHGVGKTKIEYFNEMAGKKLINSEKCIKELFDENHILNRGTLFK